VSKTSLAYSQEKAEAVGVTNIEYHNGGFLTYEHNGPQVNFIVTQTAFHHLPEFWKVIALVRMRDMLKDGGILCIRDVIFSFDPLNYAEGVDGWIAREAKPAGEGIPPERFEAHISQEYSTFSWLLEEMLKRTGFEIISAKHLTPEYTEYVCKKATRNE
jgi:ubiquinone/menaquinone biosynthesis C-methylase UbiE